MARFADYIDADYLPGQLRSAGLDDYQLYPKERTAYMAKKLWKFQPEAEDEKRSELFQRFLALQDNPEALTKASMQLPNTPFGNLGQYMGG
jgi:hypothetical protein